MEIVLWVYASLLIAGALGYLLWVAHWTYKANRYIEEAHSERYLHLLDRSLLTWPWQQGNAYHFWWRSTEDWGDPRIHELRRQANRLFRKWVLLTAIGVLGFGALALITDLLK